MRKTVFTDLQAGNAPSIGSFSEELLKEGRAKGKPQMGTTRYKPDQILFEFIFADPRGVATLLVVSVPAPQRIVFMPVPEWVIEQIWQGEVTGSYQFVSDSHRMLESVSDLLSEKNNLRFFEQ